MRIFNRFQPIRVAIVGNYIPRTCGIATFTGDLVRELSRHRSQISIDVYALDDAGDTLSYEHIAGRIDRTDPASYVLAAKEINSSGANAVWIQHEFGTFGGPDGEMVVDFVDHLAAPMILTCHTVLTEPSTNQFRVLSHLVRRASRIMVMSRRSHEILLANYNAPSEIVEIIEHGAPDRPFGREEEFKARYGLAGFTVLTTFGLLGPGKGLETVIKALPAILARHPQVLYRIIGATHPNLLAREGEAYRDSLKALAEKLGVADAIDWEERFLKTGELLDQLEACDIFLTPYSDLQQSTSGTLSYAVALGKAVISTPYAHAKELLADGVGWIIEPESVDAIANAVCGFLDNPNQFAAMRRAAYAKGRETIWPRFAAAATVCVERAIAEVPREVFQALPSFHAVAAMSDGTGIFQHAIGIVPNRSHGYCLDDNARALMLAVQSHVLDPQERQSWVLIYAAFIQDSWNADRGAFRNFMTFDRKWCEECGSEDSNGRAIWALGRAAEACDDPNIRAWAMQLYDTALPSLVNLGSPRSIGFMMLGAAAMLRAKPGHDISAEYLERGATFVERLLCGAHSPDWTWFETVLGYDNPRLSQALIEAGGTLGRSEWTEKGLKTLEWIMNRQTAANGQFRPIGSESFGHEFAHLPFDQQPLEAQAAIEAARCAYFATADARWSAHALAAWRWFFGANDRGVLLVDDETGRCCDGITPQGANINCGAESILAFQLAHLSMLSFAAIEAADHDEWLEIGSDGRELGDLLGEHGQLIALKETPFSNGREPITQDCATGAAACNAAAALSQTLRHRDPTFTASSKLASGGS